MVHDVTTFHNRSLKPRQLTPPGEDQTQGPKANKAKKLLSGKIMRVENTGEPMNE